MTRHFSLTLSIIYTKHKDIIIEFQLCNPRFFQNWNNSNQQIELFPIQFDSVSIYCIYLRWRICQCQMVIWAVPPPPLPPLATPSGRPGNCLIETRKKRKMRQWRCTFPRPWGFFWQREAFLPFLPLSSSSLLPPPHFIPILLLAFLHSSCQHHFQTISINWNCC